MAAKGEDNPQELWASAEPVGPEQETDQRDQPEQGVEDPRTLQPQHPPRRRRVRRARPLPLLDRVNGGIT
ncbi:hypothetical protein MUK42_13626 [Musa troglodytarum]|uniref:Uncharacterized protein n=1 Tax=Musa troglodytarum TaxID=320322 RepID=A0A9E7I8S6_9LILI|nr:hypothetical protein MUK42_13626 [Musa troglodytarum]